MNLKDYILILCGFTVAFGLSACQSSTNCGTSDDVIGRIEYVKIKEVDVKLKARVDTGAGVTSINAKVLKIKKSKRKKKSKVIFGIIDDTGQIKTLERDIVDWQLIKIKGTGKEERRPVVKLTICVAGHHLKGQVNLADRSQYLYPVLLGRNILKMGGFLINPRKKFSSMPSCNR